MKMRRIYRSTLALAALVMLGSLLAACGTTGKAATLLDTEWQLTQLNGNDAVPVVLVSMKFAEDGKLIGNGGCNNYMGSWKHSDSNRLALSMGASTMMACEEPVMKQEHEFSLALEQTSRYRLEGDDLSLYNADNVKVAEFATLKATELTRTKWEAVGINNGEDAVISVDATTMTAVFAPDGTVSGSGGCNTFNSSYKRGADTLEIGVIAQTAMACDQGIMIQEQRFLKALEQSKTYELGNGTLDLRGSDGQLLVMFHESK
ncbi:MAG TPA: META domain-containing protein [Thermomicrobiales bacterium]|jgi:heat shock protein HslJ|nr:hypothetical protein [Chloroflexota bacterium]HBY47477.1 hypothetical protein [Chloroflexota bacterium]HQX62948.1 META domain-containing protein [Thermomicrobiales bacterium]HQZ90132.1 META domain-containing protein [Thermomicrobiales bacterium]HRA31518.1 META domain-containing protein [Thermomicrobiales bacterium]